MKSRVIKVDQLARVEGEGALHVRIKEGKVEDVKLNIFEPPRFFEAFLRGRKYSEAPDITARICGICPVAYQMSSVHAMENAFGVAVDDSVRDLRRLLYCGEWIESHVLHIYMLHAPDFLGYDDALMLAKDRPDLVERALKMKKIGNDIVNVIGGREIHPINVRVGGFYRIPPRNDLTALLERLRWGRDAAIETVRLIAGFDFPDLEVDYECVSLYHPEEYPMLGDRIISSSGLNIPISEFESRFEERHVKHSNALHSLERGRGAYVVGPLSRFNLNFTKLPSSVRQLAEEVHVTPVIRNPFKTIIVRSIETLFAFEQAIELIERYEPQENPAPDISPRAAIGFGATEAPRGMLYHRYRTDAAGLILNARIVPPTSQNQSSIEEDLRLFVQKNLNLPREALTLRCEQAVRNYDPCISCATHFLHLELEEQENDLRD